MLKRVNLPNFTPASLSRYAVYVMCKFSLQLVECVNHLLTIFTTEKSNFPVGPMTVYNCISKQLTSNTYFQEYIIDIDKYAHTCLAVM